VLRRIDDNVGSEITLVGERANEREGERERERERERVR